MEDDGIVQVWCGAAPMAPADDWKDAADDAEVCDVCLDHIACAGYQRVKERMIATLPQRRGFTLTSEDVREHLVALLADDHEPAFDALVRELGIDVAAPAFARPGERDAAIRSSLDDGRRRSPEAERILCRLLIADACPNPARLVAVMWAMHRRARAAA